MEKMKNNKELHIQGIFNYVTQFHLAILIIYIKEYKKKMINKTYYITYPYIIIK